MRFFSLQEWSTFNSNDYIQRDSRFHAHIASIKHLLPAPAQTFYAGGGLMTLNDTRLVHLEFSFEKGTLNLLLEGAIHDGNKAVPPVVEWPVVAYGIKISYTGVTIFTTDSDPGIGLPGPFGYGDVGFDEFDVTDDKRFEHRILFSSGIELCVQFSDISFEYAPV